MTEIESAQLTAFDKWWGYESDHWDAWWSEELAERAWNAAATDTARWASAWKAAAKRYRKLLNEFMAGKYVIVTPRKADDATEPT